MNGRHMITMRWGGWTVVNTHAESGSGVAERDARESQLLHMSRLHEQENGQVFVLAGDFNFRAGEVLIPLRREGWRDASERPSLRVRVEDSCIFLQGS